MKKAIVSGLLLLLSGCFTYGNEIHDTLFINSNFIYTPDSTAIPVLAFNTSPVFSPSNAVLKATVSDTLTLRVVNNDTLDHSFFIDGAMASPVSITSGNQVNFSISFSTDGAYIYYDPSGYNSYLGLAGIVRVDNFTGKSFYWNLKEHDVTWNEAALSGNSIDENYFSPHHFTINGFSHPNILNDTMAIVEGNVGDTIRIFVANTGLMDHSLHFHGYHCSIISYSKFPSHVGRSKDTFPVEVASVLVLELVPHQPGVFPVHDHNLISATIGGNYPGGMITLMMIQP